MSTFFKLQDKINNAGSIDFGDILSDSFDLFKKTWLKGFLMVLILVVIAIPFFVALYIPMYNELLEQVQDGTYDPNNVENLPYINTDNFKLMTLGVTFIMSLLSTTLIAGFYRVLKKVDFDEGDSVSDFFYYFKVKYLGKIFTIAAFSLMIAMANLFFEKLLSPDLATILNLLLTIVLSVYTTLFVVFFAFNPELDLSSIFSLGFNLGTKKWFLIFGLAVVAGLIGILGIIGCGFGILFTISFMYLPPYLVYKYIAGFETLDDIDLIGENN